MLVAACDPSSSGPAGALTQDASPIEGQTDGGAKPADAALPIRDGSVSSGSDASVPARDASIPASDASVPIRDASVPVDEDASPEIPAVDAASPTEDCVPTLVANLRSQLNLCRTCHVQAGLAKDARYLLMEDASNDEARLRAAFTALGRDLLNVPSQQAGRTHDAGRLIVPGSADYAAWDALLKALADPVLGCRQ